MTTHRILLITLLTLITFQIANAQNDDDVIKIDSSIVVLNVAVADATGYAVSGLEQKQFRVFEDGVEQQIVSFGTEETPFAAVILLDTSGSMEERVTLARAAAIHFLDGLRYNDNVAIYNFQSKIELVQDFSNSRNLREQAFDLKADGMTVLNDAIYKAAQLLSTRAEKRRAIIVLSDGADTRSGRSSDAALKAAILANATIYSVDMAPMKTGGGDRMQNQGVLKNFAEKTGGKFVATPGGIAMRDAFKRIVEELGQQYTVAYQPSNTTKDGKWRAIEVRVARPNLAIRTRKGYNAPKK